MRVQVDTYRIGRKREWLWRLFGRRREFVLRYGWLLLPLFQHFQYRGTADRWRRTWQAELRPNPRGRDAQRGWTQRGARRRMAARR